MTTKGAKTRERILAEAEKLVLANGYSGTAVEDILAATGLTKGAFFYHFKSNKDLARSLVERFWKRDSAVFYRLIERARTLGDDPLQIALIFVNLFEETLEGARKDGNKEPLKCLFASYLYEGEQFDESIHSYIRQAFKEWEQIFLSLLDPVLASHDPRIKVTGQELAEMIMELIEGGFVLAQGTGDSRALGRASRYFRHHLQMLFAS